MKNVDYIVQVSVNVDSKEKIYGGSCTCPAGATGQCSHVAAILFHIHGNISSTDVSCQWKKKKDIVHATRTIEEMILHDDENKPSHVSVPTQLSIAPDERNKVREYCKELLKELRIPLPVSWLLADEPSEEKKLPAYFKEMEPILFMNECAITPEEVVEIANVTVGQFQNPLFCRLRNYRLTGCNIGFVVLAAKRNSFPPSLFKKLIGAHSTNDPHRPKPKAIAWGHDHEDAAYDAVNAVLAKSGIQMQKCGIFLHECGFLGASPDGVHKDSVLEIKCLYTERDTDNLEVALQMPRKKNGMPKTSGRYLMNYCTVTKKWVPYLDHPYYHQLQAQLYFAKKNTAYFCVWTPKVQKIFKFKKNPSWANNIPMLMDFYAEKFYHFLMTSPDVVGTAAM